jgi:hypothetical protein
MGGTMPQVGGGGQAGAMTPAGAAPRDRPNFLGRAAGAVGDLLGGAARGVGKWMDTPVRNSSLTRGDLLFEGLGNIGRGLATTGSLSTGVALASQGQKELFARDRKQQESEEERQYRRLEMDLKRRALEQKVAPQTHVIGAGGALVGPGGEVLFEDKGTQKDPTSIEAALFSDKPEIRARAEELRNAAAKIKGQPTEHQRQTLELSRKRLEVEIAKANRPSGSPSAPAPTQVEKLLAARRALPPGHPDIPVFDRAIEKETRFASDTGGATADGAPKFKPLPADMTGKAAAVTGGVEDVAEIKKYLFPGGKFDRRSAAAMDMPVVGGAAPGSSGGGPRARLDNAIDAIIRLRTGAGLNAEEPAYYRGIYMPGVIDNQETAETKLGLLERELKESQRLFDAAQNKPPTAEPTDLSTEGYPEPADAEGMRDYANRIATSHGLSPEKAAAIARKKYED